MKRVTQKKRKWRHDACTMVTPYVKMQTTLNMLLLIVKTVEVCKRIKT